MSIGRRSTRALYAFDRFIDSPRRCVRVRAVMLEVRSLQRRLGQCTRAAQSSSMTSRLPKWECSSAAKRPTLSELILTGPGGQRNARLDGLGPTRRRRLRVRLASAPGPQNYFGRSLGRVATGPNNWQPSSARANTRRRRSRVSSARANTNPKQLARTCRRAAARQTTRDHLSACADMDRKKLARFCRRAAARRNNSRPSSPLCRPRRHELRSRSSLQPHTRERPRSRSDLQARIAPEISTDILVKPSPTCT
jgi:hypothetical protein